MRILLLSPDAWGGRGGIAQYNRDLGEAIALHPEVEEVVVVPRVIREEPGEVPAKVRFIAGAANGKLSWIRALRRERGRFDVIVCGHVHFLPLLRFFSGPKILLLYGIEAWLRRRTSSFDELSGIASISEVTERRFRAWSGYRGPGFLLPNAIRLDAYGTMEKDAATSAQYDLEEGPVLLTVGRLAAAERYKGFDEVLEILPDVLARFPNAKYLIAGDGNDRGRLESLVRALGLADHVRFTGYFPESAKARLFSVGDVYVMPSRGEGFGFVFLEALACGLPAIGSRVDGGADALRGGLLGELVDPTNRAEILRAVLDVLESRPERRVPAGLEYFAFGRFTERVHAMIEAVRRR